MKKKAKIQNKIRSLVFVSSTFKLKKKIINTIIFITGDDILMNLIMLLLVCFERFYDPIEMSSLFFIILKILTTFFLHSLLYYDYTSYIFKYKEFLLVMKVFFNGKHNYLFFNIYFNFFLSIIKELINSVFYVYIISIREDQATYVH